MVFSAVAAPELSEADRLRLADGTTDNDGILDEQDGLYVLLRNASKWMADDFAGETAASDAPAPKYDVLKAKPAEARGNAYTITGYLVQHDRYPTTDNHDRDALIRAGDPAWGDQLTRWTIATDPKDETSTVIVLFNDPRGQIKDPGVNAKVKAAARFYKLWTIKDVNGNLFTYPVFVGGANEVLAAPSSAGTPDSGMSRLESVGLALFAIAAVFFGFRFLMKRVSNSGGGGTMLQDRLNAMRIERQRYEDSADDEDGIDEDLPEDPVQALEVLRQKHEQAPPTPD